jgi:hypothetical protein
MMEAKLAAFHGRLHRQLLRIEELEAKLTRYTRGELPDGDLLDRIAELEAALSRILRDNGLNSDNAAQARTALQDK